MGRGDRHRPRRPARLGRARRRRPDVAGRLLRPLHDPAPPHDPAGLGDPARRQPRRHPVRRARRAALLARRRRRARAAPPARRGPGRRLVALRRGPARHRLEADRGRLLVAARRGLAPRHRTPGRRLRRDPRQPGRHGVRRRRGVRPPPLRRRAHRVRRGRRGRGRHLHGLRLAGWFDHARAILVGRTNAPDHPQLTQREAVLDALGRLDLPIVLDLEIGHVPPHLPLVNGALATVTFDGEVREIVQELR
ncbi:MAG: hypothetical protein ACXVWV_04510 [Nocardioides sp.]